MKVASREPPGGMKLRFQENFDAQSTNTNRNPKLGSKIHVQSVIKDMLRKLYGVFTDLNIYLQHYSKANKMVIATVNKVQHFI